MRTTALALLGISLASIFSGCGMYFPYDPFYEGVVIVEERESFPGPDYDRRMILRATWNDHECSGSSIDLELETPSGASVIPYSSSSGRCTHLGQAYLGHGRYEQTIECYGPRYGEYEVSLINMCDCDQEVRVEYEYDDTYYITEWSEWVDVEAWGLSLITFWVD